MDSFISWIGGKKLLRKDLLTRMPTEIGRYIEVFGGAAWLLFAKDRHAKTEVYNDLDSDLANLFRCVKCHHQELQRNIIAVNSRELFEDIKSRQNIRGQTDIQRAADFFILIRTSFGSKRTDFGCSKKDIIRSIERFDEIHKRLKDVILEHRSYDNLIKTYDKADSFFYCDPPYVGTEDYYSQKFNSDDHENLQAILANIKGKFMLSYNSCDYIKELYKDFNISEVERSNSLSHKRGSQYKELIITNY